MADDTTTNNNNNNNIMSSSNRSVGGDSSVGNNNTMSEAEQSSRRKHIQDILKDPSLQASEKSKMIQALMDGRRRGSMGTISSYCSRSIQSGETLSSSGDHNTNTIPTKQDDPDDDNDNDDDVLMTDGTAAAPSDIYGYGNDHRSIASSISNGSHHHDDDINDDDTNARLLNQLPPGQYRQVHGRSYSLQDDWNETSRATAAANISSLLGTAENANPLVVARLMEQSRPACPHYDRQCTIIAPCCGLAFGCRICHDDSPVLPPPLHMRQHHQTQLLVADQMMGNNTNTKMDRRRSMPLENENYDDEEENHHLIDRFQIREVICRQCFTRQSGKTYVLVVVVLPKK